MPQSAPAGCAGIIIGLALMVWAFNTGGAGGVMLGLIGFSVLAKNLRYGEDD